MLWLMRRPWMRRLQTSSFALIPERSRPKAWRNHLAQNRFARKYGYRLLAFMYLLLLGSFLVTAAYFSVLAAFETGLIRQPS